MVTSRGHYLTTGGGGAGFGRYEQRPQVQKAQRPKLPYQIFYNKFSNIFWKYWGNWGWGNFYPIISNTILRSWQVYRFSL